MRVPKTAPIKETSPPNAGIPDAMQYAMMAVPKTQLIQVPQCTKELEVRCLELRSRRMKTYFAVKWV
jgi:hypothetical protein